MKFKNFLHWSDVSQDNIWHSFSLEKHRVEENQLEVLGFLQEFLGVGQKA